MQFVTFVINEKEVKAKASLSVLREYGKKIGTDKVNEVLQSLSEIDANDLGFSALDKFCKLVGAGVELAGNEVDESDIFDSLLLNTDKLTLYIQAIIDCVLPAEDKQKKTTAKPKPKT